jgi:short-subunit dehydrogenase
MPKPKVVLITGASRGYGKALAEYYGQQGATVIITGTNEEVLKSTESELKGKGIKIEFEVVSVVDKEKMRSCIETMDSKHGGLDLVIANAGVSGTSKTMSTEESTLNAVEINILGVLHTMFPVVDVMKKRKSGQIAIISSLSSFAAHSFGTYACTKSFEYNYGLNQRRSLLKHGIHVNVVCPGWIDTDMTKSITFPKPQMISAQQAVDYTVQGLERDEEIIAFPSMIGALLFAVVHATPYGIFMEFAKRFI